MLQTVDVQPNDGFGTLLPLESFDVDIMFNAKKAKVSHVIKRSAVRVTFN